MEKAPKKQGKEISAERLRSLREEKGITQEEIAKLLHLSRSTIVKMETAHQDIKPGHLQNLARFYETSADYILGLTEVRRAAETLPACDELGLSDSATIKLKHLKENPLHGRILSKLIEHDLFKTFLWYAENTILASGPSSHAQVADTKELTVLAKNAGYSLISSEAKKSYDLYMASLILQTIIADVSDDFFPYSTGIELENGG